MKKSEDLQYGMKGIEIVHSIRDNNLREDLETNVKLIDFGSENTDAIRNVDLRGCVIRLSNRGIGIQRRDEGSLRICGLRTCL